MLEGLKGLPFSAEFFSEDELAYFCSLLFTDSATSSFSPSSTDFGSEDFVSEDISSEEAIKDCLESEQFSELDLQSF